MERESELTLSVFTENRVGLLGRVAATFTRRSLNIESLTVSESELPGIHRFTIVVRTSRETARKLAAQIERHVDVLKAFVHTDGEVVQREVALYKVDPVRLSEAFESLIVGHGARVLERQADFVVVEHVGSDADTSALLEALRPYGVLEFVRSGRVALTRPMRPLAEFLDALERDAGNAR